EHGLPGPAHDPFVECRPDRAAVRAGHERKVPLGHGLEQGELPGRRATVPDDAQAAGVAQEPADPDGVALRPPGRMDCWLLHLADDLRAADAEMESPPRDEITRR